MQHDKSISKTASEPLLDADHPVTGVLIPRRFTLSSLSDPMPSGLVLSEFRNWEACAAHLLSSQVLKEVGDDVASTLSSVGATFDDFNACFPEIAKIEASRLALRMQSADAGVVNRSIVEISIIARASAFVHSSAETALKDLETEVTTLENVISCSTDHEEIAAAIETKGRVVGQRTLATLNFTKSVLQAGSARVGKGVGDGLEKAAADITESVIKTGFAFLVASMAGPLAGIAAAVFAFKPFAKKAEEIQKQKDDVADV